MRPFLGFVITFTFVTGGFAQTASQTATRSGLRDRLDQKVPTWRKAYGVTSVAIAYIENGKLAWTAFYGEQTPGGPPANEKTLYSVASLTKPISAEVILRLVSDAKISLDEPVSAYWTDPDVKDNPWNKLLTPRLCSSHQPGFTNWRYQTNNVLTIQWPPGSQTGCSGEGYDYVARFAQMKTGRPFEEVAQQYVFDPIGMADTSYTPRDWWAGRQAKPVESERRTKWCAADLLRSTVGDYARFIISVMHNEKVNHEIAAQRLTITRNLTTPEMESVLCEEAKEPTRCKVATGFGLGWRIARTNDETIVDHSGADGDVKTLAFYLPQRQTGVVIFTNGLHVGHQIIDKIVGILYPNRVYAATLWQVQRSVNAAQS
jgi:CubicO group peptidase (beta-lactamase class C family)